MPFVFRTRLLRVLLLAAVSAAVPAAVSAAGPRGERAGRADELLRWRFEPGTQFHVTLTQETRIVAPPDETTELLRLELLVEMDWRVDALLPDGRARMTQSFTRFTAQVRPHGGDMLAYDSAGPAPPDGPAGDLARQIQPLLSARWSLVLDPRGHVHEVAVAAAEKTEPTGALAPRWTRLLSKDGIREMLRHVMIALPEAAVSEGDTWSVGATLPTPLGTARQTTAYTYRGLADWDARPACRIEAVTKLELPQAAGTSAAELKEHQQQGTLYFDNKAGHFVRAEVAQKLSLAARPPAAQTTVRETSNLVMVMRRTPHP
ncbi:MAG: hypothetical protein FJ276_04450 [Planctomycetes bacterium]|nr:hypothetical protein [Planctomycetota bacterium]